MASVLVIDNHPVVLGGFRRLLDDAGVGEVALAANLVEGFRLYRLNQPDLIVLDLAMRHDRLGGLSFIRRLRSNDRETPVLVFSMHGEPTVVAHALSLGANGYVLKTDSPAEITTAIVHVRAGRLYLGEALACAVAFSQVNQRADPLRQLTSRELHALSLVGEGQSYAHIATNLNVSYKTVSNLCTQLRVKLGARTFAELRQIAIREMLSKSLLKRAPSTLSSPGG